MGHIMVNISNILEDRPKVFEAFTGIDSWIFQLYGTSAYVICAKMTLNVYLF